MPRLTDVVGTSPHVKPRTALAAGSALRSSRRRKLSSSKSGTTAIDDTKEGTVQCHSLCGPVVWSAGPIDAWEMRNGPTIVPLDLAGRLRRWRLPLRTGTRKLRKRASAKISSRSS